MFGCSVVTLSCSDSFRFNQSFKGGRGGGEVGRRGGGEEGRWGAGEEEVVKAAFHARKSSL